MLRSVDRWLFTEPSEQPNGPIFKGQTLQEKYLEPLSTQLYKNIRCVTSQKNEDLTVYIMYIRIPFLMIDRLMCDRAGLCIDFK
jgi:hypothetical protein